MSALGNRYECFNCEVKFYDLGKAAAICPACGTNQAEAGDAAEESKPAKKKKKKSAKKKSTKKAKPEPEAAVEPVEKSAK